VLAAAPAQTLVQSSVGATAALATVGAATAVGSATSRTRAVPLAPTTDPGDGDGEEDEEEGWPRWMIALLVALLVALAIVAVLLLRSLGYLGGTKTFSLPNVVGQTQAAATSTLEGKGLKIAPVKHAESTQPAGTVTATDPRAGATVSKGQSVTLTVSSGPPAHLVLVPKLVGLQLTDAVAQLNGLLPYRVVQQSSNQPSGQVLAQNPAPGASVKAGTTVVLTVSSQTSTSVPSLSGQSQAAAGNLLAQHNLTVGTVTQSCSSDGSVPSGDVISSNPASGTSLPPQSPVALVVSTGPCQVILQNVVGQSEASATATLKGQSSQLTVNPVNTHSCPASQNGNVTAQSPTGGTQVSSSSTVTITVCNNAGGGTTTTTGGGGTTTTTNAGTTTTT
jgi:serine/threonine-protein kinase